MKVKPAENLSRTNIPGERWKHIKGFEGYYQVSDMGRVKSLRRWIELHFESRGYAAYRWISEHITDRKFV